MSSIRLGSPGWIYCMTNASMPGLVKLGQTTLEPTERAKQLTASTASPTPFHVVYSRAVDDCNVAEEALHRAFADRRVNDSREFFRISVYEAARTIDALCGDVFSQLEPPTPFAELFATFDPDGPAELTPEEQAKCRALEARPSTIFG